jgi:hypothetical protein
MLPYEARIERKVICKVLEAKNVMPVKGNTSSNQTPPSSNGNASATGSPSLQRSQTYESYATVSLDDRKYKTAVVQAGTGAAVTNPFWSEDFEFTELSEEFGPLTVTVWRKNANTLGHTTTEPLGRVTFPRTILTSGDFKSEQWFAMNPVDVESTVTGELRVKVVHELKRKETDCDKFLVTSK